MNCKQILAIANEAISMLPHAETLELRVRLAQATSSTLRKTSGKVNQRNVWIAEALAEYRAWVQTGETVANFHNRVVQPFMRGEVSENIVKVKGFDADAYIKKMERCACGHMAVDHAKDELENLLKCSDCGCGHFHYEVIAESEAA